MALQDGEKVPATTCRHRKLVVVASQPNSTFPQYEADMGTVTLGCDDCDAKWQEDYNDDFYRIDS